MWTSSNLLRAAVAALVLGHISSALAQKSWNSAVDSTWNVSNNWTPPGVPGGADTVTVGNILGTEGTRVTLDISPSILTFTMVNGNELDTGDFELIVNGLATLSGNTTDLILKANNGGAADSFDADNVTVNTGAEIRLIGGRLEVDGGGAVGVLTINAGADLFGYGAIDLEANVAAGTSVLTLNGDLTAGNAQDGSIIIIGDVARTLTINATTGSLNLDQGTSTVTVGRAATLDINAPLTDPYSATMNMLANSTLDMSDAWEMDFGNLNVNTQAGIFVGQPAGTATIAGATMTFSGGSINLDNAADSLVFDAVLNATGGTINQSTGKITFNSNSTIGAGVDFQNGASTELEVNATLTVNDANWDMDASGGATRIVTINDAGTLNANITDAAADDIWSAVMHINGGILNVQADNNDWGQNGGSINIGGTTTSTVAGDTFIQTGGTFNVAANAIGSFSAASTWSGGTLDVDGQMTLSGTTTFLGSSVTGNGTLRTGGTTNFNAVTTINMPSGTVDLDGGPGDLFGATVTVNENTTINAGTMASFGNINIAGTNTLVLNLFASLTVNLTDPNAEWTLNSSGVLDINAIGGMFGGSGIQGSDFNMAGTANISGNSIWTARTDISGTVNVAAAGSFNLRGGTLVDTNRLEGGTITGDGVLQALIDEGLVGFGTINTDIDFANNTVLRADDGTLTVTGPIIDVGSIGTADTDGILNVTPAWNTNVANVGVTLLGGQLNGAGGITNDLASGISGFGTINAVVQNNTQISANGGLLRVIDADFDGNTETGVLNAIGGDMSLSQGAAAFGFDGTVNIGLGRVLQVIGFNLQNHSASDINLAGGTYRSNVANTFGGTINVNGATSTIDSPGTFLASGANNINADLQLDQSMTIDAGATFGGTGALVNLNGSTLTVQTGATIGVELENRGTLVIGTSPGQIGVNAFTQTAAGSLPIEIGGLFPGTQFDQLLVTGTASLAGTLNVSLAGGFMPALGQTFNIIQAAGVVGTFGTTTLPDLPGILSFRVNYFAGAVQLEVVDLIPGDFDSDGDVDGADFVIWQTNFPAGGGHTLATGDADGDGDVDGADFVIWQTNFPYPPGPGTSPVPEPAAWMLAVVALIGVTTRGRRQGLRREVVEAGNNSVVFP